MTSVGVSLRYVDTCSNDLLVVLRFCMEMCYLRAKSAEQFIDFTVADKIHIGEIGAF